jgi:uncharacterized protein YgfB (UPF0149 family)
VTPSSATPSLDYDRLRESLAAAGAVVALAELHGGVCGALCAGGPDAARRWLSDSLDDAELGASAAALSDDLEELISTSSKMLEDDELAFEPLLPSDDSPLAEQVEALAVWCQGFLGGVGSAAPGSSVEGDALAEILRDFAEISRAGFTDDEAEGEVESRFRARADPRIRARQRAARVRGAGPARPPRAKYTDGQRSPK